MEEKIKLIVNSGCKSMQWKKRQGIMTDGGGCLIKWFIINV